jgi:hypothetical protein
MQPPLSHRLGARSALLCTSSAEPPARRAVRSYNSGGERRYRHREQGAVLKTIFRQPAGEQTSRKEKTMASEGVDLQASAMPPVAAVAAASRENARRQKDGQRPGASIILGLVAVAIAALSAVALWLSP